ncbi:hypothetical protein AcW2_000056 [Taiwanofungus camphoratus]|nr:hypothetical protein AcW2_000056 [Antrodia cinnamomea]
MILPNLALNVLLFTSMTTALDLRHQMSNAASPTLPRTSTPSPGFDATVVALTRDARVRTQTTIPSSLTTVAKRQGSSISDTGASSSNTGHAATTCVAPPTESRESSHSVAATSTPARRTQRDRKLHRAGFHNSYNASHDSHVPPRRPKQHRRAQLCRGSRSCDSFRTFRGGFSG